MLPSASPQARLEEAVGLAAAIDLDVAASGLVPVPNPRPATLFGSGKVEELAGLMRAEDAGLVIVDHPLTPVQQRNLEKAWNAKVLDRTGLILEIFGERARTREGRLQVELAHLAYQKSRLVRSWTHLERQRGGFGFLGGPGETQIETDRRLISERIDVIRKELEHVRRTRALAPEIARARALSVGRAGRLHQCRQVDPVQRADRRRGARRGHAVRHARSDHQGFAAAWRLEGGPVRHRGLHLRSADHAGRRLPRHAGRGAARPI